MATARMTRGYLNGFGGHMDWLYDDPSPLTPLPCRHGED